MQMHYNVDKICTLTLSLSCSLARALSFFSLMKRTIYEIYGATFNRYELSLDYKRGFNT